MNLLEHTEELFNEIQNRLEKYEHSTEESVERIHNQLEKHKNVAEEQIERLNDELHRQTESAEEEIRRLHNYLEEYHRNVEEQIQKIHEASEEYGRKIEEEIERIQDRIENTRENAEEQIERISEQIEKNEENAEEQIERLREQAEEYKDHYDERVERIRERMDELSDDTDHHQTERRHFATERWVGEKTVEDTVQLLMNRYNTEYNKQHGLITISNIYVINGVEILKYSGKLLPLNEMDELYPRREWLQTLLDMSISIENIDDYSRYLNARDKLIRIKEKPDVWTSGLFNISPTENWKTYQEAYINHLSNPDKEPNA